MDWEEAWEHYRWLEAPILQAFWPDLGDADLVDAAALLATVHAAGVAIHANGDLERRDVLDEDEQQRWRDAWPHTRELLAFERALDQDLAALVAGHA